MAPSMVASMMRDSTRMEFARYRSSEEFMSFVRLDVTVFLVDDGQCCCW